MRPCRIKHLALAVRPMMSGGIKVHRNFSPIVFIVAESPLAPVRWPQYSVTWTGRFARSSQSTRSCSEPNMRTELPGA